MLMLPGLQVDGADNSRTAEKNIHLFHLVLADLGVDRRNVSKQKPPPLLRAVDPSLPRCYDNLIIVYHACAIVY